MYAFTSYFCKFFLALVFLGYLAVLVVIIWRPLTSLLRGCMKWLIANTTPAVRKVPPRITKSSAGEARPREAGVLGARILGS